MSDRRTQGRGIPGTCVRLQRDLLLPRLVQQVLVGILSLRCPQHSACPQTLTSIKITENRLWLGLCVTQRRLLQISRGWNFVISISAFEEGFTNSWRWKILFFSSSANFGIIIGFNLHMHFWGFVCFTPPHPLGVLKDLISSCALLSWIPGWPSLTAHHSLARAGAGRVLIVF